ncbi:hypothetical protein [Clostridium sp. DJ247]|uniref:hypothetical protein n=1 Tax=Clostridium sp. DJ247 TaxID=2726188 RepID=UPI00162A908D|nr:hypothetical protein [Clostridium sp. DJ247]MBC2581857.1 hypothetical protein [Clostridium sp. DJ247]
MNTIISNNTADKQFNFTINRFFKDNKIGYILKQVSKYAIPAYYVLFDSWVTYPKTLI